MAALTGSFFIAAAAVQGNAGYGNPALGGFAAQGNLLGAHQIAAQPILGTLVANGAGLSSIAGSAALLIGPVRAAGGVTRANPLIGPFVVAAQGYHQLSPPQFATAQTVFAP